MDYKQLLTNPTLTHTATFLSAWGSKWFLGLIKYAPAPLKKQLWRGAMFDATQDIVNNNERVKERRDSEQPVQNIIVQHAQPTAETVIKDVKSAETT